jgi:hypothetical protein
VQAVFDRFITTEYTTIDRAGRPITWPVIPFYEPGGRSIDVSTGLGYPKKAHDARANPMVALLFSDPTGSGLDRPPAVLVQGIADVDDRDLDANRARYAREAPVKLPGASELMPPRPLQSFFDFYFQRIYVRVRPERVYVWRGGRGDEPELFDSHIEEVRSGHDEEPDVQRRAPEGGEPAWDRRMNQLGDLYRNAVLSLVAPDGFPFSVRVPVRAERSSRRVRIELEPVGAPLEEGAACLTAHDHEPSFRWQRNFQVRGDLVEEGGEWALVPHRLVGGFEAPPSAVRRYVTNARKLVRFRRVAKRELRARAGSR